MQSDESRPDVLPYLSEGQVVKDGRIWEYVWNDWCRTDLIPDDLTVLDGYNDPNYRFQRPKEPDFMKGVNVKNPTFQQGKYIAAEDDRCYKDGYWFFLRGKLTWLTPWQYMIMCYWKPKAETKDGRLEYRNRDRLLMLYCWNTYKFWKEYGVIYAKGRRLSATMFQHFLAYWFATLKEEQRSGLSATDEKLSKQNFVKFLVNPIRKLPKWMGYTIIVTKDSITFSEPSHALRNGRESESLNSVIRLESSTLMGFDGDEMNFIGQDEIGKVTRFDISEWWDIQEKTMINMGKKIGFAFLPSTSNKIEKGGGNYKKFFFDADLATTEGGLYPTTSNKLRNFFLPSYIGQPGYVGPDGEDIIEAPTDEQYASMLENNPDAERIGAKRKLERDAEQKKKQRETMWMEERRQNPFTIFDVFSSLNPFCPFEINILNDLLVAVEAPEVKDRIQAGYFKALDKQRCRLPVWIPDPKGPVFRTWEPPKETIGKFGEKDRRLIPLNHRLGIIGLDPYAKTEVKEEGSKQGAAGKLYFNEAYERANVRHIELNGCNFPDYIPTPAYFLHYVNRQNDPRDPNWDFEQMALIAQYYSMPIAVENNRSDAFEKYMLEYGLTGFLLRKFEILGLYPSKENQEVGVFTGSSEQSKDGNIGHAVMHHNSFLQGESVYLKEFTYHIADQPLRYPFKQAIQEDMDFNLIDREKSDGTMARMMLSLGEYNINDYGNVKWYAHQLQDGGSVKSQNWKRSGFFYTRRTA